MNVVDERANHGANIVGTLLCLLFHYFIVFICLCHFVPVRSNDDVMRYAEIVTRYRRRLCITRSVVIVIDSNENVIFSADILHNKIQNW